MTPEDIPEDATPDELDWYEENAKRLANEAAVDGDLKAWGNLARVGMTARQMRLREAPPVKEDPNDAVDLLALGPIVAEKWHKLVSQVVKL